MKNESQFENGNRSTKEPFFNFQENEIDKLIDFVIKDAFEGLSDTDPWSVERSIRAWFKSYQPERLSPEDHIVDDNEMVSDSLNSTNK
jgi:hypothetical protein